MKPRYKVGDKIRITNDVPDRYPELKKFQKEDGFLTVNSTYINQQGDICYNFDCYNDGRDWGWLHIDENSELYVKYFRKPKK